MNVFADGIKPYWDVSSSSGASFKAVREIKFSTGGHLFAVANKTFVFIFTF